MSGIQMDRTTFDHLNTRLVQNSDPHCILYLTFEVWTFVWLGLFWMPSRIFNIQELIFKKSDFEFFRIWDGQFQNTQKCTTKVLTYGVARTFQ